MAKAGGQSPGCHRRSPGSISGHFIFTWGFTKWHWDNICLWTSDFTLTVSFHQCFILIH